MLLKRLYVDYNMHIKFTPVPDRDTKIMNLFKRCATVKLWLPDILPEERAVINIDTGILT